MNYHLDMSGVFIAGTDTGVGKTCITASLVYALRRDGIDAVAMKPLATGKARKGVFESEDAEILARYSDADEDEYRLINPVFLPEEASPYMACKLLNMSIDMSKVFYAYDTLKDKHEFLLVEGIGGVMVPISSGYYVIDMMKDMGLPVIIVARAKVGTINHTLLTVNACRDNGLRVTGIVVNMIDYSNRVEAYTPSVIEELSGIPVIGSIPLLHDINKSIEKLAGYIRYDLIIS
jgi:dethiobiotin synthetase